MNCVDCQDRLEDFLYGELGATHSAAVSAHLAGCAACSAVRDALERESAIFAGFYEQTALEPTAEMWEAISRRIRTESPPQPETGSDWLMGLAGAGIWAWLSKPMIWRQAAFAALLVAISVSATIFFFKRSQQPDGPLARRQDPSPSVETPTPAPASATPPVVTPAVTPAPKRSVPVPSAKPLTERELLDRQIVRAEREYRGAIRLLDRAIAKRQDQFDPELVKQYESSLALIDESIAASRRAFRERPGDLAAGQFLLAAYARKVELMQDLALR